MVFRGHCMRLLLVCPSRSPTDGLVVHLRPRTGHEEATGHDHTRAMQAARVAKSTMMKEITPMYVMDIPNVVMYLHRTSHPPKGHFQSSDDRRKHPTWAGLGQSSLYPTAGAILFRSGACRQGAAVPVI